MAKVTYSWILPIKDEALSLPQLLSEITKTMKGKTYEIIAVNDASKDNSGKTLQALAKNYRALKIIHLGQHVGKWGALKTGFTHAKGDIIITSDSDLQDGPKEVLKLLAKIQDGYDMSSGWRKRRYDPMYKLLLSKIGNNIVSILQGHHFHDINAPFKLYRREVLADLPTQGSLMRFSMLFAKRLGYKIIEVPIVHRPRIYGKSKFGIVKYIRIIYDLILMLLLFSGSGRLHRHKK